MYNIQSIIKTMGTTSRAYSWNEIRPHGSLLSVFDFSYDVFGAGADAELATPDAEA